MTTANQRRNFRAVDLFSGVGGFSLSAARAGFVMSDAIEIDKFAVVAHKLNFPNCKTHSVDLADLSSEKFMQLMKTTSAERIDLLVGGPPCQGFSVIGGNKENDPRNNLFIRFFQFALAVKPTFIVAENVPGILGDRNHKYVEEAYKTIANEYDMLDPIVISANDLGAPTTRKRVFFIGVRKDSKILLSRDDFNFEGSKKVSVAEALYGLPVDVENLQGGLTKVTYGKSEFDIHLSSDIPEGVGNKETIDAVRNHKTVNGMLPTKHSAAVLIRYNSLKNGEQDKTSKSVRLRPDGFCPTLRAGTDNTKGSYQAVRPIHPTASRVITPREAARLQGFPDWFTFDKTIWHSFRQIGNSVSPIVGKRILSVIHEKLRGLDVTS